MTDALGPQLLDRHAHLCGSLRHVVFAAVRGEAQPGATGLLDQRREATQLEADVAIRKVEPDEGLAVLDDEVSGVGGLCLGQNLAHDADQADGHIRMARTVHPAHDRAVNPFEVGPAAAFGDEVGRVAQLEDTNALAAPILANFVSEPLDDFLGDPERLDLGELAERDGEVGHRLGDQPLAPEGLLIGRNLDPDRARDIANDIRRDAPFQVTMKLDFWQRLDIHP